MIGNSSVILRLSRTRHFIIVSFCRFYLSIQTALALSCLKGAFSLFSFCVYNPTFKVVEKVFRFSKSKVCCSRFLEKTAFFQKEKIMRDSLPSCFLFTCLGKISWNQVCGVELKNEFTFLKMLFNCIYFCAKVCMKIENQYFIMKI